MNRSRIKFLLMALLFATPLAAAWLLFFVFPEYQPARLLNHGTLVSPARPLPALELTDPAGQFTGINGKWALVYLGAAACDAACNERLLMTRQMRLVLRGDAGRVQRLYVAPSPDALNTAHAQLAAAHPDLKFVADVGAPGHRAADFFAGGPAADANAIYLLDPLGNWLMVYTGAVEPKGLLKDLKKLLRFSTVG